MNLIGRAPMVTGSSSGIGRSAHGRLIVAILLCGSPLLAVRVSLADVVHDAGRKTVLLSTTDKSLALRLNYDGKCLLDQVLVRGQEVVPAATGVCSGIQVAGRWYTTRADVSPNVTTTDQAVTVAGIVLGGGGVELNETWAFAVGTDQITWRIARNYVTGGTIEDTYFPGWDFTERVWTGALLGTGGVAWFKLFDTPVATYGVHTGPVTYWNKDQDACLRIVPVVAKGDHVAVRFSRNPHGVISCNHSVTPAELAPKHGQYRFLRDRQDVWAPFEVKPGVTAVEFTLSAPKYSEAYDRGTLQGIDGAAVREICNTIGRLGAIDANVHGSNGWYSGFAVLQEQWIAQLGLAIDDPFYFRSYADTLDFQRDHAIGPDGRVKSRWHYAPGDDMPGTYDAFGFYECQWGWMLDSQPCFVTNVAEQFDFSGDVEWVRRHKSTCEKALDYMLARDSNDNGLVEIMTNSHTEKRGGDWLDIVWTAFENGLINAQMYNALLLWADVEDVLSDLAKAARYRECARKLKDRFNRPTAEGGLWDPEHGCYAHWREKDGSIHGTNMVTPVHFMAVAYGMCDDPARRAGILDRIEAQMQREQLFMWPLCMTSFAPEEGGGGDAPFPAYENGDIFLGWGEMGVRAYAPYRPAVAVRCVKNVLAKYAQDGLAFQRYLRKSQAGEGSDILSNMANPVVGLYRDIYGVQPKWNRLYLEPHLTPELAGTRLKYWLRDHTYTIDLKPDEHAISVDGFTVREQRPFGMSVNGGVLSYFPGARPTASLTIEPDRPSSLEVTIEDWPADPTGQRKWRVSSKQGNAGIRYALCDLPPNTEWQLSGSASSLDLWRSDSAGRLTFMVGVVADKPAEFILGPPAVE